VAAAVGGSAMTFAWKILGTILLTLAFPIAVLIDFLTGSKVSESVSQSLKSLWRKDGTK
jgi:hypothetical protein